jgi:hypothetical protein
LVEVIENAFPVSVPRRPRAWLIPCPGAAFP